MLIKFFAVTATSIYKIGVEDGYPYVEKIAMQSSSLVRLGTRLDSRAMLSIGRQLYMFIPEGGGITSFARDIEQVNTRWWAARTSEVNALFLSEKQARMCFAAEDRVLADPRWIDQTKQVLEAIGEEHPVFSITHSPSLCLVPMQAPTPPE